MKRAIVVLLAAAVSACTGAQASPAMSREGSAAVSAFLQDAVTNGDVPGVVALVTGRDGVLYEGAFGRLNVARDVPMPVDAIFRIASMTKAVTSVGVMMLVEEGRIELDEDAATYLPELGAPGVVTSVDEATGAFETRPAIRPVTIRHLLTHTSGIGYAWSDPRLAVIQGKGKVAEADLPLLHDPGERWTYGASTHVLGQIIERVSGQRIDAFLQSRVLGPLGMTDTSFEVPRASYSRVVTTHQKGDGGITEQQNPETLAVSLRGDGGLYSTAGDYARFLRMFLNGGTLDGVRLLREETIREMTRTQTGTVVVEQQPSANAALSKPYPLGAGADTWGLGFQLAAPPTSPLARSAGSYSWAGIFNTFFWVDPAREIGAVLLMQVLPFYDDAAIRLLRGFEERVDAEVSGGS